jgi:hypothetical protein
VGTGLSIQNSCSAFTSQIKSQAATINSADCASLRTEVQSGKYGTPTARCASCQSRRQQQLFLHAARAPEIASGVQGSRAVAVCQDRTKSTRLRLVRCSVACAAQAASNEEHYVSGLPWSQMLAAAQQKLHRLNLN